MIVWQKKHSRSAAQYRLGSRYRILIYATKGERPRVFNKLRSDAPLEPHQRNPRQKGTLLTDVWSDIADLPGSEMLTDDKGERAVKSQLPIALLARIMLISSMPGDTVLDPCCGTGTALVAAGQLGRLSIGMETDPAVCDMVEYRIGYPRAADSLKQLAHYYRHTTGLNAIWGSQVAASEYGTPDLQQTLSDDL